MKPLSSSRKSPERKRDGLAISNRPTRGGGLLETWLAQLRAKQANKLIPNTLRSGRILDIGCGSYPYFLAHTFFRERVGVDRMASSSDLPDVTTVRFNFA